MKRTSSNSLRSASWTWHISAPILCVVFLSLITPFHLRLALSGSILPYLPFMTDSSGSSPSSPNTKPEPLQGPCCCHPNPGLSGSSCASVPLPMPDSKQRCAKYVVKSSKILWNSHTRNLNAFYRILLILPLLLTYHVVSNEIKRTSSNSLRSASWTWHISAPIFCTFFLSLISPFHIRLALSGSILPYLPFMTDSSGSSPSSPNTKPEPLQGPCCWNANSGLSGSSSAWVPLPMPHRRQSSSHLSASCKGFETVCIVSCHTGIRHIEHQLNNASGFGRFCSSHFALARMPSKWSHHSGHPEFSKFWDCSTEPCAPPGPCRVETEDPSRIQMRDCAETKCWNRYRNEGTEEKREKVYPPNKRLKINTLLSWTLISGKPCSKLLSLSEWGRLIFAALEFQNL